MIQLVIDRRRGMILGSIKGYIINVRSHGFVFLQLVLGLIACMTISFVDAYIKVNLVFLSI